MFAHFPLSSQHKAQQQKRIERCWASAGLAVQTDRRCINRCGTRQDRILRVRCLRPAQRAPTVGIIPVVPVVTVDETSTTRKEEGSEHKVRESERHKERKIGRAIEAHKIISFFQRKRTKKEEVKKKRKEKMELKFTRRRERSDDAGHGSADHLVQ